MKFLICKLHSNNPALTSGNHYRILFEDENKYVIKDDIGDLKEIYYNSKNFVSYFVLDE